MACSAVTPNSLAGPPNTVATVVLGEGTQNFTCVGGKRELTGAHTNLYSTEPTAAGDKTLMGGWVGGRAGTGWREASWRVGEAGGVREGRGVGCSTA